MIKNRALLCLFISLFFSCSILETRPTQEMADTISALRAAKEVGADTIAPELYRQAIEAYTRAKNEYKFKNFSLTKIYALKAKKLAEKAEFASISQGSSRSSIIPPEEPPPPEPSLESPPTKAGPEGTPAFLMDEPKSDANKTTPPATNPN